MFTAIRQIWRARDVASKERDFDRAHYLDDLLSEARRFTSLDGRYLGAYWADRAIERAADQGLDLLAVRRPGTRCEYVLRFRDDEPFGWESFEGQEA